jgi:hypothetical protein
MLERIHLLTLAFLLLIMSGCRKDKDETGPVIEILSPGNGYSLNIPDTLAIVVTVSDDRTVGTVRISLANDNGVPIAAPINVTVNAPSATIERSMIVDSEHVVSGTYSLSVHASDGTNTTSAFRSVLVTEAPLRLRALFIIPPGSGPITRIDSVGGQSNAGSVQNMSEAEINSFGQHLYLAGGPNAPLQVMAASPQGTSWQLTNQNATAGPYFTRLRTDPYDQRTYVSSNDGLIRAFKTGSTPVFNAQAFPGFRPYDNVVVGDRLMSEQHAIGQDEKRLVAYAYHSGALLQNFPLDIDVVEMYRHSDQQALLFGNRDGDGVIQLRNVVQGGMYEMRIFDDQEIIAVEQLTPTSYVVALQYQLIRFSYANNSIYPLLNMTVSDIAYDRANGSILAGSGQEILVIDPTTGNVVNNITVPTSIGWILPLLNR